MGRSVAKECIRMRNVWKHRGIAGLIVISGLLPSTGCTRNYYYGGLPGCGPTQVIPGATQYGSTIQYGNICEVPTQVVGGSGGIIAQSSEISTPLLSRGKPPRVVISEPLGSGSRPRYSWRATDPENGLATTKVEGAVEDSTTVR